MKFFSGFCLNNESDLFSEYIPKQQASIVGFSYGAIKAFNHSLATKDFFKKLILLSPAFYKQTSIDFREAQVASFKADPKLYELKLLKKAGLTDTEIEKYAKIGTVSELSELLNFEWGEDGFEKLLTNRVEIEVYLGSNDKIVDATASMEFFKNFATVYYIKNKNHFLR